MLCVLTTFFTLSLHRINIFNKPRQHHPSQPEYRLFSFANFRNSTRHLKVTRSIFPPFPLLPLLHTPILEPCLITSDWSRAPRICEASLKALAMAAPTTSTHPAAPASILQAAASPRADPWIPLPRYPDRSHGKAVFSSPQATAIYAEARACKRKL